MKLLSTSVAGVDVLDREINPLVRRCGNAPLFYTTSTRAETAAWICTGVQTSTMTGERTRWDMIWTFSQAQKCVRERERSCNKGLTIQRTNYYYYPFQITPISSLEKFTLTTAVTKTLLKIRNHWFLFGIIALLHFWYCIESSAQAI